MRVAVVSPYDLGRPGGVQDQAIRLVRWLGEAGHEATLFGPGVDGPEDAMLLGATKAVPINRSRAPVSLDFRVAGPLRRELSGFDVVHIHEPLVPAVSLAAIGASGPAKVGTFHADPSQLVRGLYRYGRPLVSRMLGNIDVFTAVSPIAAAPLAGIETRIIPNGLDIDEYGLSEKIPGRVTFLGRDDPRKGLQVMLDAWPRVLGAVPEASLHVLGADRSDAAGVTFLGRVSEEEKRAELAAATVHSAPNLGGESFGIVVLEAMASGCAVVASTLPAFADLTGDLAVLVPVGEAGALADAVVALLTDPQRARVTGDRARKRAARFDGSVVASQYIEAYEDALESSPRASG